MADRSLLETGEPSNREPDANGFAHPREDDPDLLPVEPMAYHDGASLPITEEEYQTILHQARNPGPPKEALIRAIRENRRGRHPTPE